jgi:hypothetical protein
LIKLLIPSAIHCCKPEKGVTNNIITAPYMMSVIKGNTSKLLSKKCVEKRWKYNMTNGAVPTWAAIDTVMMSLILRIMPLDTWGNMADNLGWRMRMDATAVNDSWKLTSNSHNGLYKSMPKAVSANT